MTRRRNTSVSAWANIVGSAMRPSRQTCLLAVLVSVYKPDPTKIREALVDLARPPTDAG
jgi:hypothetical protein